MAYKQRKSTLVAAVGFLALLTVACGTRGNNVVVPGDDLPPTGTGVGTGVGTGTGTTTTGTTGTVTSGALTGGVSGVTPVINPTASPVPVVGLAGRDMLPALGQIAGTTNAPTRLDLADFGPDLGGLRPVVVQGNQQNPVGGTVITLLARNPNVTTPGTGNLRLNIAAGTTGGIFTPFGLEVVEQTAPSLPAIFVTELRDIPNGGIVRVDNIQTNGNATATRIATGLSRPIDLVFDPAEQGGRLFVAEYQTSGAGGRVSIVDPTGVAPVQNLITGLNAPSSVALDSTNGRRVLYVTENFAGGGGDQGRVLRIDLTAARPAQPTAFTPTSPGVTVIQPAPGDSDFQNPWDLAVDGSGNVVITDGLTYNPATPGLTVVPAAGTIRVIPGATAGNPLSNTAKIVVRGLQGPRGPSMVAEAAGTDTTVFFVQGQNAQTSSLHQLTFRVTDAAIYRFLTLFTDGQSALDTLYDAGSTAGTVVAPNVKYTVNFFQNPNGRVIDVR